MKFIFYVILSTYLTLLLFSVAAQIADWLALLTLILVPALIGKGIDFLEIRGSFLSRKQRTKDALGKIRNI